MRTLRSFGFSVAAVVAAAATMTLCFGEAMGLVRPGAGPLDSAAIAASPTGSTTRPINTLQGARAWLTPVPGGVRSLRGKVVVVNFWTYSCINSLRALPYLRAWDERYRAVGLVVVGVHAPEFEFERDPVRVRLATRQLEIGYPNLQDNGYATWQALGNEGWPSIYYIDSSGRTRGYRLGEGGYTEGETLIRKLLAESGKDLSHIPIAPIVGGGIEASADWPHLGSPEAYLGSDKATGFSSPGGARPKIAADYAQAPRLSLNGWDLAGQWKIGPEYATATGVGGAIRFRFHARDAHIVLGRDPISRPVKFRVTIDGAAPGASHGSDIDAAGWGELREDQLYQLVRQTGDIRDRTVAIEFLQPGARAYVFTFG